MSRKIRKRTQEEAPRVKLREIKSFHIVIGRFSIFIGVGEVRST